MTLNEMYNMNAALEFFSAAVSLVLLIGILSEGIRRDLLSELTAAVLAVNAATVAVDAPVWLLLKNPSPDKIVLLKILSFFSDGGSCALVALYTYCLTAYIRRRKEISFVFAHVVAGLSAAAALLCLLSAFNGMYIGYDENGMSVHGKLYFVSQAVFVVLPALSTGLVFRCRAALGIRRTLVTVLFGAIPVCAVPLQLFWEVTPVYLATTVSFVLLFVLINAEQIRDSAEKDKKLAEQELELAESRNAVVLSQIQPHFLFNALTSIYRLCDVDPSEAKRAVGEFSTYLRGNLDSLRQKAPVFFDEELKHIRAYLALEKIRYGDQLNAVFDIRATGFMIPVLTVQPLVENAVTHGLSDAADGGTVVLSSEDGGDCYVIRVCDNGTGFDPSLPREDGRSHTGIANVRSRLAAACGGTLEIASERGKGTVATVKIPKGEEKE